METEWRGRERSGVDSLQLRYHPEQSVGAVKGAKRSTAEGTTDKEGRVRNSMNPGRLYSNVLFAKHISNLH